MILIRNIGELLTLKGVADKDGRKVSEADLGLSGRGQALLVDKGLIAWLGAEDQLSAEQFKAVTEEIDLSGAVVMPAFIECHTHMVFAGSRSHEYEMRNQGVSYQEISRQGGGILSTVRATRQASEQQLLKLAQKRERHFLEQGVTTIEIKSGYALDFEGEAKMLLTAQSLKLARVVTTYLGAHALPPEAQGDHNAYLEKLVKVDLPKIKDQGLSNRCDIFIENGFFSLDQGRVYLREAKKLGFDLCIHADQLSRSEATALAIEMGAKSADHAIELTDDDIANLARSEVVAVLLPAADFYMKCPYPKARRMIDEGGIVALATDFNPGTCPTQDLAMVGFLARHEMKMTLPEVISAYTYGAAKALGLEKTLGSLEVGKTADFITLSDEWTSLFYSVGRTPVTSVYKEGQRIS